MSSKIIFNQIFDKKVLEIQLNNASKNNALSIDMLDIMISKLSNDKFIKKFKCIVLTGVNQEPFSSGADLKDIKKLIATKNINLYHYKINTLISIFARIDIPTVSLLRKYCFGAGLILALSTDFTFACKNTLFCIPASKLDIKIPKKQILFLKKKINENFLKDILISSRKFTSTEAYSQKLITACIKNENFEKYSYNYINEIINNDKKLNAYYFKLLKS
jgi:enoyl-CoA hydratase/carnithine racemase